MTTYVFETANAWGTVTPNINITNYAINTRAREEVLQQPIAGYPQEELPKPRGSFSKLVSAEKKVV